MTSAHGTRSRYNSGCRCGECRRANREYEHSRKMRKVAEECGAPASMVDAGPVREKLACLRAQGYSGREICRLSGLSRSCLRGIERTHHRSGRPVAKVRRETKDAIFSIKGKRMPAAAQLVDAGWMAGWVRGYKASGMSVARMLRISGIDRQVLDAVSKGKQATVTGRTFYEFVRSKPRLDEAARKEAG